MNVKYEYNVDVLERIGIFYPFSPHNNTVYGLEKMGDTLNYSKSKLLETSFIKEIGKYRLDLCNADNSFFVVLDNLGIVNEMTNPYSKGFAGNEFKDMIVNGNVDIMSNSSDNPSFIVDSLCDYSAVKTSEVNNYIVYVADFDPLAMLFYDNTIINKPDFFYLLKEEQILRLNNIGFIRFVEYFNREIKKRFLNRFKLLREDLNFYY